MDRRVSDSADSGQAVASQVEEGVWHQFAETDQAVQSQTDRLAGALAMHVDDQCTHQGFGPVLLAA